MGHFAFVSFPGFGHVRPTLAVVEELLARGHRVTYLVTHRFAGDVAATGADVVRYDSAFPEPVPSPPDPVRIMVDFVRESFAPLGAALTAFEGNPPDVIVHDALVADTAAVLGRKFSVPKVRLYPGFGGNAQVPLNGSGGVAPDASDAAFAALGQELAAMVRGLGVERYVDPFVASGDDAVHNLVFVPAGFQPQLSSFSDRYSFVGPCLLAAELEKRWTPPVDLPVVLISLGTSSGFSPSFFRMCAEAFASLPWQVLMTLGRSVDPVSLGPLPSNVSAHRWLPHLAVLPHASVFVCQAGGGSVMEALYRGTPMVVVPRSADSVAIAERVVELRAGRLLASVTPESLVREVALVASDPAIRAGVGELQRAVMAAGGAARAADLLIAQLG
jgi:MGT family glycosyltransferase